MNNATIKPEPVKQNVLASRNFRLLWLGQAISTFGDKFTEIAIPILVYSLTGSAMQLGFAFLTQTVATLLFGLFAGAMADKWDRRRTMIVSDIIRTGLVWSILAIPLLPISFTMQLVALYTISFFTAATKQFFMPAKIATIPETVDKSQLMAANSLDQTTVTLIGFFGFAAAGGLIGWLGEEAAFGIDGLTFLVSAVLIGMMRLPRSAANTDAQPKSVWADILAGLKHVWSVPILRGTVLLSLFAPLALGATQALILIFSREVLRAGAFGFGLLEGSFGLGSALGAFLLARYAASVPRGRLLAVGVIGMGIGQMFAVATPILLSRTLELSSTGLMAVSMPFFFLGAVCNAAIFIGIRTIVQENAPNEMIGRVFSVIMVVSSAALAIGAATAGFADIWGSGVMLFVWAIVLTITGLFALNWRTFQEA